MSSPPSGILQEVKKLLEEAVPHVKNIRLYDAQNWMDDNLHHFTPQPNCYSCGLYVLSSMRMESGTAMSRLEGTIF